ncbi:MAG: DCC1-like thiol-disulfide oxidoreductase family protein [Sphingorhabdus sp.]
MQRLDKRRAITFIDISRSDSSCPISRELMLARLHAEEDGIMHSGAGAFGVMWRAIPLLRPLGLAVRIRLIRSAMEWLYLRYLTIRPRLQAALRNLGA